MSSIPFIDIHTHQDNFYQDVKSLIAIELSESNHDLKKEKTYTIGVHPWKLLEHNLDFLNEKVANFSNYDSFVAVGEIGLDKLIKVDLEVQKKLFVSQLTLAKAMQKPVIIHCVKAHDELIKIKCEFDTRISWIYHGFNKNQQIADRLLKAGLYLSFGKSLLYNEKLQKVFCNMPLNKVFLETDDEDISIKMIYEKAAELRKIEIDDLKSTLITNYNICFKI